MVKHDKNLIKRMFVQLHFGETWTFQWSRYFFGQLFTVAALALDGPIPAIENHWKPCHWPRMCEKFCEINFKKAKWEGLIFKGFSMIFLWGSIATWYIQFTHIHTTSLEGFCVHVSDAWVGSLCPPSKTIQQDPTGSNWIQQVSSILGLTHISHMTPDAFQISKVLFSLSRL